MLEGKVRWFDEKKGFGFIARDEDRDIFVHYSAIQENGFRTLHEGDPVQFEVAEGPHGTHAINVLKLSMMEMQRS
jgi:cold shock protein